MPGRLRVTQTRSTISHIARNRATVRALGLKRIGHTVEIPDNPATRGMVRQVRFLVRIDLQAARGQYAAPVSRALDLLERLPDPRQAHFPGLPIGGWLDRDFDWHNHHLLAWDREHPRPPTLWSRRPGQPPPRSCLPGGRPRHPPGFPPRD